MRRRTLLIQADWQSKAAWENYGPSVNSDESHPIVATEEVDLTKLPVSVAFEDADGEGYPIHCCDHQESVNNSVKFISKSKDGLFEIEFNGEIIMDGDEEEKHPFRIVSKSAKQVEEFN